MATITELLASIQSSKAAIKKAITDKGVACDDVLSSYAARIESIPTPKIQSLSDRAFLNNGQFTIEPDEGYDAMSEVAVSVEVSSIKSVNIRISSLFEGQVFDVEIHLNGQEIIRLCVYEDAQDPESIRIYTDICVPSENVSWANSRFIFYQLLGTDHVSKMWLAKCNYKEATKLLQVTILREIPINPAQ